MITFKCLGSGSKGNCYLISDENETLILDAGIPSIYVKEALDFNMMRIKGVLVTHVHGDHSAFAKDYVKYGIPVWKPYEEEPKQQKKVFGGFEVFCFDLPHDGTENRGFIIRKNNEVILYMTDFQYCKYKFYPAIRINHMIIEANYSNDLINYNAFNRTHVLRGHAELQTTIRFIEANQTPSLRTVILAHLSDGNAEPQYFINEVSKTAKCGLYIATKGLEIELKEKTDE